VEQALHFQYQAFGVGELLGGGIGHGDASWGEAGAVIVDAAWRRV
jgi:hypothetical protein